MFSGEGYRVLCCCAERGGGKRVSGCRCRDAIEVRE